MLFQPITCRLRKTLLVSPLSSHIFENHFREESLWVVAKPLPLFSSYQSRRKDIRLYFPQRSTFTTFHQTKDVFLTNYNDKCKIILRNFASGPEVQQRFQDFDKGKEDLKAESVTSLTLPEKFVKNVPEKLQPYLKLSRIDRPIGTWLLFWPSTWGLAVGSGGMPDLTLLALFGAGAFVMRGAGCTVNDMWDRHIDPRVKRTSRRPLASRQIRMRHAVVWLGGQLSLAFAILLQLNWSCFLVSCGALGLVCLYPLAKRITHWPQGVLGMTFNTGILIGFAATHPNQTGFFDVPYVDPTCLSLYFSGVLWTLIYDTIYAHQDLKDDTLLGLGSTARRFGENTKLWLSGFSCLMMSSLITAGLTANMAWPYYVGLCGVSGHLFWQIYSLDIKNVTNCGDRFNSNKHIGWLIAMSILTSYWIKDTEKKDIPALLKPSTEISKDLPVTNYSSIAKSSI